MRRSREHLGLGVTLWLAFCFPRLHAFTFPIPFLEPYTSQRDEDNFCQNFGNAVDAINDLYAALGSPDLDGWTEFGGDPCKEAWKGVQCDGPNVTAIELRGAGLGGKLSRTVGDLTALTLLDLSNNQIGGAIPQSLPPALTLLDLSSNSLSGELPDSIAKLSSLSTLHVQDNQLSGTLDVLKDLPLTDLNVENNQFSGSIPEKLLSVPKFLRDGNKFTIPSIPGFSPTPPPPPLIPSTSPPSPIHPKHGPASAAPQEPPVLSGSHPPIYVIPASPQDAPQRHSNKVSPAKAAGFSILAAGSLSITVVAIVFTVSRWRQKRSLRVGFLRGVEMNTPSWVREPPGISAVAKPENERHSAAEEKIDWPPRDYVKVSGSSIHPSFKNSSKDIIVSGSDTNVQGSSEGQPQQFPFTFFTVASLQQHTNSFSDQNLIRETRFGKIYVADHPGSKFSVLKLGGDTTNMPVVEFLKIVQGISELRHPNVEELVGCCVDHGQRLLVYKHFSDNTLADMICFEHRASEPAGTLPWDSRVAVALEAATALEYLHEGSPKQVVHRHFRPEHILVDGELRVSVSGVGLAPFVQQMSDYCSSGALSYEPLEAADSGGAAWTAKGDVYSFGVVMLQLLTGRKPYDSSRVRGERYLVPWASPRMHDLAALGKMADPRLGAAAPPVRSLSRFADIVGRCVQQEAEFRPAMSQVAQDLRRALEDARGGTGSGGAAQG